MGRSPNWSTRQVGPTRSVYAPRKATAIVLRASPLGVADVFAIKVDADSDPKLIEAARAAGFTVVDA
jgi:hypothetical protein